MAYRSHCPSICTEPHKYLSHKKVIHRYQRQPAFDHFYRCVARSGLPKYHAINRGKGTQIPPKTLEMEIEVALSIKAKRFIA
jgi:hypothetical protein